MLIILSKLERINMCKKCGYSFDSTRHLLFWQFEWLKRFLLTWYHIINRKAYRRWLVKKYFISNLSAEQIAKVLIADSNRPWDVLQYKNPFGIFQHNDN